jgi:hypothetical protein
VKLYVRIFAKHIERFSKSVKWKKNAIFWANLLPDAVGYGLKVICQDDGHGKTKKMYISDFTFLKLCHTVFSETY